jgi:hypothetical protein
MRCAQRDWWIQAFAPHTFQTPPERVFAYANLPSRSVFRQTASITPQKEVARLRSLGIASGDAIKTSVIAADFWTRITRHLPLKHNGKIPSISR